MRRFIDIGANLTDSMYAGIYNNSKKHEADLLEVLKRSWDAGLQQLIITGGNLEESKKSLQLAQTNEKLYSTVGCHPTRCTEFESNPEEYYDKLKQLAVAGGSKIVAIGECGLDYDRIQFCPKETQQKYFKSQLKLSEALQLPLFLHCRNAADDLYEIISKYDNLHGVVHSFDGTLREALRFIDLGYYIGINGCSLKTKENLVTVAALPNDRILLETDCPWCEIRPTHAGYKLISKENHLESIKKEKWKANCAVKGRNEPANIRQVLDVIAGIKKENIDVLCEQVYQNTLALFFKGRDI